MSYCYDISETNDVSIVRSGVGVKRLTVRSKVPGEDTSSGGMAADRSVKDTKMTGILFFGYYKKLYRMAQRGK